MFFVYTKTIRRFPNIIERISVMKNVGIYLRVSTSGQSTEMQQHALMEVAKRSNWNVVQIYTDSGVSGSVSHRNRPAFKALLDAVTRREIDVIAVWSIDRLGRSLQDLVGFLQEVESLGCDLYMHQQNIDTSTPSGKLLFHMCSVFAEFERGIISERVCAGLEKAKANGKQLGRPKIDDDKEMKIRKMLEDGTGILKTAKTVGCGTSVVQRISNEMAH